MRTTGAVGRMGQGALIFALLLGRERDRPGELPRLFRGPQGVGGVFWPWSGVPGHGVCSVSVCV